MYRFVEFCLMIWLRVNNFIQDIKPCGVEQDYEPFISKFWGGIVEGCDWTSGKGVPEQDLLDRPWSQIELYNPSTNTEGDENYNGCQSINSIDPKYLTIFRGTSICMKRGKFNFFNAIRPDINGVCPNNTSSCGESSTPPSKIIWVEKLEDCPINGIKIMKSGSGSIPDGYKAIPLEDGWQLLTSSNANDLPIEDTKLSEGAPCINPYEIDMTKNRYIYPLTRIINNETYRYHGCQDSINNEIFKDQRYTKIDQVDEEKLFKDNGIWLQVKDLPMNQMEYISSSYFYGLFIKSSLELDLSCEYSDQNLSRNDIKEREKEFSYIDYWHKFLNKACLFFISAVLILFIPFLFMVLASWFAQNLSLLKLIKSWSVFSNITIIIITVGIILITFVSMYFNWHLSEFIFLIVKNECSNKQQLHVWVHLYEILLVSNQLKFFVIGACVFSIFVQTMFLKFFWDVGKPSENDRENEDNRVSASKLRD